MLADEHRTRLLAVVVAVAAVVALVGGVALAVGGGFDSGVADPSSREVGHVDSIHRAGVTGEGVRVGVLVATGVDPDESAYRDRVAATRAFGAEDSVRNGGNHGHGTATTALVSRVAPDATLYLASFDTDAEFERGLAWLQRQGVDVVVSPVAFYGRAGDGTSRPASASDRTAADTVVVAPVGNVGRGHWAGNFTRDERSRHRFSGGARNYLEARDGRELTLWLSWDGASETTDGTGAERANLSVELYRQTGESSRLVARSRPFEGDDAPNEWLVERLDPGGTYYVVVTGPESAAGIPFEMSSPTHAFQYRERGGSVVAPATARRVVAVGAYDPDTGSSRPFSSAGPVDSGRPGVDVVAPDGQRVPGADGRFVGTSASSAYAAGVAALVLDANPDLDPRQVEAILEATAADAGQAGVDPVTGHGRLAPERAVKRARNVSGR